MKNVKELQPWEAKPYSLVSWLDMLQFSAYMYFYCGRALREIRMECFLASIPGSGDKPLFLMTSPVDEKARAKAIKALKYAEPEFRKVGLSITASMAKDLIADLEGDKRKGQHYQWLVDKVSTIETLADKEL